MTRLTLDQLSHALLPPSSAECRAGLYAVLEPNRDAAASLISLCAGSRAPSFGRVLLDGQSPYDEPTARARIATLEADETLLPARTVHSSLEQVLALRGQSTKAPALLERWGLTRLAAHAPLALGPLERRSLALALALAHEQAALLLLHEPLSTQLDLEAVRAELARAAEARVVIATVSRFEDALDLGARIVTVRPGGWRELPFERPGTRALRVRVAAADSLAQELERQSDVLQVIRVGRRELVVRGTALEPLAQTIAQVARSAGVSIEGLREQFEPYAVVVATPAQPAIRHDPATPEHMRPIYGPGTPS